MPTKPNPWVCISHMLTMQYLQEKLLIFNCSDYIFAVSVIFFKSCRGLELKDKVLRSLESSLSTYIFKAFSFPVFQQRNIITKEHNSKLFTRHVDITCCRHTYLNKPFNTSKVYLLRLPTISLTSRPTKEPQLYITL